MQDREYFTRDEAESLVGQEVEALASFPSVPRGSRGDVVKAARYAGDRYVATVKWQLPRPNQLVDLTVIEISFNFFRRRSAVTDEFCKSEFAELLKVTRPVDNA